MKKFTEKLDTYPHIKEWIDKKMEDFNNSFACCYQSVFRNGLAEEVAEYAKQGIIKSYRNQ